MRKISDYLKEEREIQNLTLKDVEDETKIKKEILENIENGKFDQLPSESYAIGFVKTYAKFLGISPNKAVAMYRRENALESLNVVPSYQKHQGKFQRKIINPKVLIALLASFFVLVFIAFQYNSFFFGPSLTIIEPQNGEIIEGNAVLVSGETNPYATVTVDGEEARVQIDGKFEKNILVFTGEKEITIISKNRFGKETIEKVTVKIKQ